MKVDENGPEVKLLQVFISKETSSTGPLVSEVTFNHEHGLQCSCNSYHKDKMCKHIIFVKSRLDDHGEYPPIFNMSLTDEEKEIVESSNETFRTYVLEHGKIEVL